MSLHSLKTQVLTSTAVLVGVLCLGLTPVSAQVSINNSNTNTFNPTITVNNRCPDGCTVAQVTVTPSPVPTAVPTAVPTKAPVATATPTASPVAVTKGGVGGAPTVSKGGTTLTQDDINELPKTGLPLVGLLLAGALPLGYRLRKFGQEGVNTGVANGLWEERQFKKS
jgi:hypothetical protein